MEIERKFLIDSIPDGIDLSQKEEYEQSYLCTAPVVRIRKEDDAYWLTYKSAGMMMREEHNLPLTKDAYEHLLPKADPGQIKKTRYRIPLDATHTIELDRFHGNLSPLLMAEVEFSSEEDANSFVPPTWFGKEVTYDSRYHNSTLIHLTYQDLKD